MMRRLFETSNDEELLSRYLVSVKNDEHECGHDINNVNTFKQNRKLIALSYPKRMMNIIFRRALISNFSFLIKFVSACTASVFLLTVGDAVIANRNQNITPKIGLSQQSNTGNTADLKDKLISTVAMTHITSEDGSSLAIIPEPSTLTYMSIACVCSVIFCSCKKNKEVMK